jgi:fatty-acyl-CoA synthase
MDSARTFNLADLFDEVADAVPQREAVVVGDLRVDYQRLQQRVTQLASWMLARGVGAGDTVGLQLFNGIEYLEAFLAACKIKAVPVNINYRYVADELRYLYDNSGIKALVYSGDLGTRVSEALDAAANLAVVIRLGERTASIPGEVDYEETVSAASGTAANDVLRSDEDLSVLYTGGTTGKPKGVIWPHKALFYSALGGGCAYTPALGPVAAPGELAERARGAHPMRSMPVAPLMHGAALWATLMSLYAGHTIVISDRRAFDAEHILDMLAREKVSFCNIVGDAMAVPLLDALQAHPGRWELSRLMAVGSGGAHLSGHVQAGLKQVLPHIYIANGAGSSEAGMFSGGTKTAEGAMFRLAPHPDLEVLVDGSRKADAGETGILARTGMVPVGYLGDPEKTARTFVSFEGRRYALTGDIAKRDRDGSILVYGRDSNCINTGGEKVFVEEVEEALRRHPGVYDCLVVGLPDPRWGSKVVGVVAKRPDEAAGQEELRAHCRQHLSDYKVPKDIVFVDAVQRSPAGKGDYRWAANAAAQALA